MFLIAAGCSLLLLAVTGIPLFRYLRKREFHKKSARALIAVFLVATILTVGFLASPVTMSMKYKSKMQWYIDDLKSQGFNVEYRGATSLVGMRGGKESVSSYSEFVQTAKDIDSSVVWFYGGTPEYFVFFVDNSFEIIAHQEGYPYYSFWFNLNQ